MAKFAKDVTLVLEIDEESNQFAAISALDEESKEAIVASFFEAMLEMLNANASWATVKIETPDGP